MELRVLRYFLTIAKEENITRAAQILHITQPTLSRQIQQLEVELKVQLFQRAKHRIVLTEAGMRLKLRAQDLVDLAERTKEEMLQKDAIISGEISIGCGETRNLEFLTEVMEQFRSMYPEVYFTIYTGNADDVIARMDKGLLDFGVLIEPVDISRFQFIRMPEADKWTVLMLKTHPLAKKEFVTPEDLIHEDLILSGRRSVNNQLEHWFGPYADQLKPAAFMNLSLFNKCVLVEKGLGLALGLDFSYVPDNMVMIPMKPEISNGAFLVWKKNLYLSPTLGRFTDAVRRHLAEVEAKKE
ncbi:MAG: LysR family transcriptional regulator [Acidaminococcus sp.]|jgi:DNA-binding transcriptional LysR family regulator|nr:LysR family transcriptional regulator [Acidaminococcus sp.]MCI2100569.1 LysR family transcriptional regulator [Acidaminococcus sp.]MCI2114886.1 LysR family transcriptional regulator [Acidaminococcus sp.]MCI2116992.1 LysR family transcriptional regulator [Acidaminococcus sp.]